MVFYLQNLLHTFCKIASNLCTLIQNTIFIGCTISTTSASSNGLITETLTSLDFIAYFCRTLAGAIKLDHEYCYAQSAINLASPPGLPLPFPDIPHCIREGERNTWGRGYNKPSRSTFDLGCLKVHLTCSKGIQ